MVNKRQRIEYSEYLARKQQQIDKLREQKSSMF